MSATDIFDGNGEAYGWIGTYSGGRISPFNPRPEDIRMQDIVASLPHICRFGGQIIWLYSVATHSCMIYEYGKQALGVTNEKELAWALLHDAAEAYIGDVPRPVKHAIPAFQEIDNRIMAAIAEKYDLGECPEWVKYADRHIVAREAHVLFPTPPDWTDAYDDLGTEVPVWDVDESRHQFLFRLKAVMGDDVLNN